VRLRIEMLASLSLALLLTGCPLTDHYQLLSQDAAGAPGAGSQSSAGAPGGSSSTSAGSDGFSGAVGDNGGSSGGSAGHSSSGTSGGPGCSNACNAKRACGVNGCTSGWVTMAPPPSGLVARSKAVSVAMGKAVFIWGGLDNAGAALDTGAIYSPTTDTWTFLPKDPGSPSARIMATAVWTGNASNKVIVYGGTDASGNMVYRDGAVYDVANNAWAPLPPNPMGSKRSAPFGYWDGTRAVFYGGMASAINAAPGADRFDLKSWSASTSSGDPGLLASPATAFDGSVMYLQGGVIGSTRQDKVFAYTSSTDSWASLSKSLSARTGSFGAWDGSRFVVWGGQDDAGLCNDGKALSGMTWSEMSVAGAPDARRIAFRRSGWSFQVNPGVIAVLGGLTSLTGIGLLSTGGATYDVVNARWTAISDWTSRQSHEYGIGVWTGEEFVLWGGRDQNVSTLVGERWAP